jgi:pyocin large subunit-like protein
VILRFLLFVVVGISSSLCYQPDLAAWDSTTVQAHNFAPGRLEEHYQKHGYQFGHITEEQYLEGAQALLDAEPGPDVLEKIRFNGDIEHFRVSTGEFAVMTKRGRIRTYFKTHYEYWLSRQ